MNNNFSLFDNYPFLKPLNDEESRHVEKLYETLSDQNDSIPGLPHIDTFTDDMMLTLIRKLYDQSSMNQKPWLQFLEYFFNHGHDTKLKSPTLRSYLLIQIAKKHNLSRYLNDHERLELAYCALHSSYESREILLKNAKHFGITQEEVLTDLAFKGILLGGANVINLSEFLPLRHEVIKQLVFMISHIDRDKAHNELENLESILGASFSEIKHQLKAS